MTEEISIYARVFERVCVFACALLEKVDRERERERERERKVIESPSQSIDENVCFFFFFLVLQPG